MGALNSATGKIIIGGIEYVRDAAGNLVRKAASNPGKAAVATSATGGGSTLAFDPLGWFSDERSLQSPGSTGTNVLPGPSDFKVDFSNLGSIGNYRDLESPLNPKSMGSAQKLAKGSMDSLGVDMDSFKVDSGEAASLAPLEAAGARLTDAAVASEDAHDTYRLRENRASQEREDQYNAWKQAIQSVGERTKAHRQATRDLEDQKSTIDERWRESDARPGKGKRFLRSLKRAGQLFNPLVSAEEFHTFKDKPKNRWAAGELEPFVASEEEARNALETAMIDFDTNEKLWGAVGDETEYREGVGMESRRDLVSAGSSEFSARAGTREAAEDTRRSDREFELAKAQATSDALHRSFDLNISFMNLVEVAEGMKMKAKELEQKLQEGQMGLARDRMELALKTINSRYSIANAALDIGQKAAQGQFHEQAVLRFNQAQMENWINSDMTELPQIYRVRYTEDEKGNKTAMGFDIVTSVKDIQKHLQHSYKDRLASINNAFRIGNFNDIIPENYAPGIVEANKVLLDMTKRLGAPQLKLMQDMMALDEQMAGGGIL